MGATVAGLAPRGRLMVLGAADGFALVFMSPTNSVSSVGGAGGNLGYGGISNSAAVAFDIWQQSRITTGTYKIETSIRYAEKHSDEREAIIGGDPNQTKLEGVA